jgi:acetoin utilization deacetylase AcuC-like enzyme
VDAIAAFGPDVLIVSLGVDTFHNDPISDLAVTTEGFRAQGELVAQLALPTVILQEGGYDVAAIGDNVRAFLLGVSTGV